MSEHPTEYGKALVEACARAAYEACPATNITTREPISWEDRSPIAKHVEVLRVRAALLAAFARLREPSPEMVKAMIDADDLRTGAETCKHIVRSWLSELLTEIGSPDRTREG